MFLTDYVTARAHQFVFNLVLHKDVFYVRSCWQEEGREQSAETEWPWKLIAGLLRGLQRDTFGNSNALLGSIEPTLV